MNSNRTARGRAIGAVAALAVVGACKVDDAAERRAEAERRAQVAQAEARMRAAREADERQGNGRAADPQPATAPDRLRREEDEARRRDAEEAVERRRRQAEEDERRRQWAALTPAQRRAAERAAEQALAARRGEYAEGLDRGFVREGLEVQRVEARGRVLYIEYIGCGRVFLDRFAGEPPRADDLRALGFTSVRCHNGVATYWDLPLGAPDAPSGP
jgi:hypothetical protein